MTIRRSILAILTVATVLALSAVARPASKPAPCPADVTNLSATVLNDDPSYVLLPDIAGQPYKTGGTGNNKITAMFQQGNCTFDFTLNLNYSSRYVQVNLPGMPSTAKFFNFDRVGSVPVTDGGAAFQSWCNGGVQKNADGSIKVVNGLYQDVYAPCGSETDPVTGAVRYFARRNVGMDLVGVYNLRFQNSPIEGVSQLSNSTALIRVYHYAATQTSAERWELSPERDYYTFTSYNAPITGYFTDTSGTPDQQYRASLLYIPTNGPTTVAGYPSAPFRMVVTKF